MYWNSIFIRRLILNATVSVFGAYNGEKSSMTTTCSYNLDVLRNNISEQHSNMSNKNTTMWEDIKKNIPYKIWKRISFISSCNTSVKQKLFMLDKLNISSEKMSSQ